MYLQDGFVAFPWAKPAESRQDSAVTGYLAEWPLEWSVAKSGEPAGCWVERASKQPASLAYPRKLESAAGECLEWFASL